MTQVRLDKWLWAVRLFKTRVLATEACKAGFVKLDGRALKASYAPKVGDIFTVRVAKVVRTVEVVDLLEKRVGAQLVFKYMNDLTPLEVLQVAREARRTLLPRRERGSGRPTKKERRDQDKFIGD